MPNLQHTALPGIQAALLRYHLMFLRFFLCIYLPIFILLTVGLNSFWFVTGIFLEEQMSGTII
jgi:hypothetical protein